MFNARFHRAAHFRPPMAPGVKLIFGIKLA
jgi:hypothetical protein